MKYLSYSLLAGLFTWGLTILGSMTVFGLKKTNNKIISLILGLGGGIMVAASFFSLILPALEYSENLEFIPWVTCIIGFLGGILFVVLFDYILSKNNKIKSNENNKSNILMIISIILHNIPEGLAIGVAFGSLSLGLDEVTLTSAILLSIGIGLQNFPEGAAISVPLAATGVSKFKAFLIGALSAIVEPICALLGTFLVLLIRSILPFSLLSAAAIMIYVVVNEIIPTAKSYHEHYATNGFMIGFVIMMILDLAFG